MEQCKHNFIQKDANWKVCKHCGFIQPLTTNYFKPSGDNEFLQTQFPGNGGSNIHEKTEQEEIDEIAQWINNEKYQPEVNLWAEVAKEFHFDKSFHKSVVEAITQRLIQKGFKITKTPTTNEQQ